MAPSKKMVNPELAVNEERQRNRVHLARLEADIAYFQARLEMIGDPVSTNQVAQRKVFKLLHKATSTKVLEAKRIYSELT